MVIDLHICHNFRLCLGLGPRDPLAVLTVERQTTLPWVGHVAGFHSDRWNLFLFCIFSRWDTYPYLDVAIYFKIQKIVPLDLRRHVYYFCFSK